jgi:hypothetical protein
VAIVTFTLNYNTEMCVAKNKACTTNSVMIMIKRQTLKPHVNEMLQYLWHAWDRTEKSTSVWWRSLKERDHMEDRGEDGSMVSEWMLGRLTGGGGWSGF